MDDKRTGRGKIHKSKRRTLKLVGLLGLAAAVFVGGWEAKTWAGTGYVLPAPFTAFGSTLVSTIGLKPSLVNEKVDVFGGSIAHGWVDPNNDSYLRRAFALRSESTNTNYDYIDHTIIGETPVMLQQSGQYQQWLQEDRPKIVVLSWGMLNSMDSKHKTTVTAFGDAVHQEIATALALHAMVLIVTPPVVKASATTLHSKQEIFIRKLFAEANSFKSKNVVTFDVYHQMEEYLKAHGQTYADYYNGNSWHPDEAGHELAGLILYNDFVQKFGVSPIRYKFSPAL